MSAPNYVGPLSGSDKPLTLRPEDIYRDALQRIAGKASLIGEDWSYLQARAALYAGRDAEGKPPCFYEP